VPAPAGVRRKVHPVTPLVHAARTVPAVVIFGILFGGSSVGRYGLWGIGLILLAVLVVGGVTAGVSFLQWRRLEFWFDDDGDLRVDSGVITRQERRLQLSRLQAVDVVQPLVARIFGMAELRIEVAGAGDSRATLQFLTLAEAEALRAEVLARAAGVRHDAGAAPETVIATVPTDELALSLLLRGVTFSLLVLTAVVLVATFMTAGPGGLLLVLFTGGVPLFVVFGEFSRYFGFTVATSPDGLRLRHGLLQTQSQTVPPGRVQAVGFVSPLLWRGRGWVRVTLNIAGVGSQDGQGNDVVESVLLPVAPWPVARLVAAYVLPGVDIDAVPMAGVPERARWRSPFQWRRLGVGHDDQVFVARTGWLTHRTSVIPHARTQSVRVEQGPWERALGLASMYVDSTRGPVSVRGLRREAADARAIAEAQVVRARTARAAAPPQKWLSGGDAPQDEQGEAAAAPPAD
jgi:putative membrane protein